jgi:hypothetical protein
MLTSGKITMVRRYSYVAPGSSERKGGQKKRVGHRWVATDEWTQMGRDRWVGTDG